MRPTSGYAALSPTSRLEPFDFERREPGPHDVLIEILYCGICHTDIHQVRGDWGRSFYPMVPGHEIVGRVAEVGEKVRLFQPGDLAGVGCFVDSCRACISCKEGVEQYCENHLVLTYNGFESDLKTRTFGGYSSQIVVDENYVLHIPPRLDPAGAAPLLCAGITTYSPLIHFGIGHNDRVAVVGLGGLGHLAVKLAASMGAEVTVLSTSPEKKKDAPQLGAADFVLTEDGDTMKSLANQFDFILDCVSASHDVSAYLAMLRRDGTMVLLGAPEKPIGVSPFALIPNRRRLAGSLMGGIRETQEMLDYCAEKNITSDIEIIPIQAVDAAYYRTLKGDVHYRFVIDMTTL